MHIHACTGNLLELFTPCKLEPVPLHSVWISHWISWIQDQGLDFLPKQILHLHAFFLSHTSTVISWFHTSFKSSLQCYFTCIFALQHLTLSFSFLSFCPPSCLLHQFESSPYNLPQSHSSELSLQSACPSHQSSRGTHSWLAHSTSSFSQNAARRKNTVCTEKKNNQHEMHIGTGKKFRGEGRHGTDMQPRVFRRIPHAVDKRTFCCLIPMSTQTELSFFLFSPCRWKLQSGRCIISL